MAKLGTYINILYPILNYETMDFGRVKEKKLRNYSNY